MNKLKLFMKSKYANKILMLIGLVALLLISFFIIKNSFGDVNSTILKDQEVENLLFKNAKLEYVDGISTLEVEVENTTNDLNLKYIAIDFVDENDESTRLIGYIGDSLSGNETKLIVASVDKDITNATKVVYSIIK